MTTHFLRVPMVSPWLHMFRITLTRVLLALLVIGVSAITSLPQQVSAQQLTTQLVVIVVRDGAGNPMMGVPIKILIDDPPTFEEHDQCVTGQDGACTVHLLPNTYRIQFVQGWRGRPFIPVEEQIVFNTTVRPTNQILYCTYVIGERDGQLVPVWDMSADPAQPPKPFMPSFTEEDPLASLNLGPLTTGLPGTSQPAGAPAAPDTTATSQVVVDVVGSGAAASPTIEAATPSPAVGQASSNSSLRTILVVLIVLVALAVLILLLVVIARSRATKER